MLRMSLLALERERVGFDQWSSSKVRPGRLRRHRARPKKPVCAANGPGVPAPPNINERISSAAEYRMLFRTRALKLSKVLPDALDKWI